MKNVPFMVKGVFRVALTTAMREVLRGHDDSDELRKERCWKCSRYSQECCWHGLEVGEFPNESCRHGSTCSRKDSGIC